jgi:excisionase family DNA binding protein
MTDQVGASQYATVPEAARVLGVSVQTVRRMIRRGQIEGRRVHRPQGSAFIVTLPLERPGTNDAPTTDQVLRAGARANGPTPAPAGELMAAWSETFLGPIMARMAEQETSLRALERENGRLAERLGQVTAELEALRASQSPGAPNLMPESPESSLEPEPQPDPFRTPLPPTPNAGPWWRRWLAAVSG